LRFLLVDRILELERGRRARGIKSVTMSEDFLTHHFPEAPIMPGALLAESLVQLADWVIRDGSDHRQVGLAVSFESARFHRLARPGDRLDLEVELVDRDDGTARFKGQVSRDGQRVAAARFTLSVEDAEELLSEDDSRRSLANLLGGERKGWME